MGVALVTGASRGIGAAIALRLAGDGFDLFLTARSEASLAETAAAVRDLGRRAMVCAADLADVGSRGQEGRGESHPGWRVVSDAFIAGYERLDVLVNNAGSAPSAPFGDYEPGQWRQVMALNAASPFFLTQELLPLLRAAAPGYLVNIGSVVSRKGYANQTLYSASKHALLGWTKALAQEVSSDEVRIHAILPGGVDTELVRSVRPDIDTSELISPHEVADVVAQLLSMRGNAVIDQVEIRRRSKPAFQ